jgi:hypothetical protein
MICYSLLDECSEFLKVWEKNMDPITTAIVAALSSGVLGGLTEASKTAITDAYGKLKMLLTKKFGGESEVIHAVNEVEAKPNSAGRKAMLQEEIAAVKADQDQEILLLAQTLLAQVATQPGGKEYVQKAMGDYNIQVQGSGNTIQQTKG